MFAFFIRMFQSVGAWLGAASIASATLEIAKWASWKVLLTAFWFTGVYVLFNNLLVYAMNMIAAMMPSVYGVDAPVNSLSMQLSGIGAYMAQHLMLVESFSALMTGVSLAVVRMFLPWPIGRQYQYSKNIQNT